MKRALGILRLIVAASAVATSATLPARGDYLTFDIASHEAMADYTRFESRSWAENAEGEGGRLAANTVWSGGEHVIVSDIYIPSGVTLTINAGTVVKFREGTRIKVEDGGSLVINGASGNEVVLEGYDDETVFTGIVLQSSAASYSDNSFVIVRGFNFGRYATVSLNNTTAFLGGGQALVPVDVSGSRDTAFSFDWVAETNGVTFASGTMNWNRVSDGRKNIMVPYPDGLPGCSNFVIRAVTFRCCSPNASECVVTLSEFVTTDIFSHEAMADYIAFESREWAAGMVGEGGRLATNATWSGKHTIVSDVYIPSGVTLTLAADTVVEFCEGTRIKIEDGGTLNIVGADGHDVILRGAEGVANFGGIVKMPNGTFTDNSYFRFEGFTYGALANVALHDSSTFRSSGLALIPVTVSGSRSTAFSIDWVAETNGVPYKTGTLKWNGVSEGTKNISINYGAELDGYTNFTLRAAVDRACKTSPNTCTIKISDFIVSDIASHESMADSIRFESRDWAADLEGEGGRLAANATWEGTHKIASDVYIPSGVTLTLAADAVVEFYEGTRIKIEDGGTLNIVGANGHDVIIRGAEGVTNYVGIVKMPNGTYTDNMYVQYTDRPYPAYPYITVHEATTYREAGKMWVAFSLSGTTRDQSFNVDWSTDKGDSGTLTWSSSSDGTKWIEIPVDSELVGGTTNHVINLTAARGCNISVGKSVLTILEPNYNVKGQVALAESDTQSNEFAVNGGIKTQPLFLNDVETVQYSGKWQTYDANEAAVLRVTLETDNGATVLKEASPSETGAFDLNLKQYPVGYYTLKHEILNDLGETLATMQKTFSIADEEDVELHGGTLKQNEVWSADKVHVVYETVVVPSIYTIFIEPGAIVKFMTGTGIDISQGGAFFANRIVFTHINDDTVGGDTLNDGFTVAPPMDAYFLSGAFTFGDDTELRGITQNNALTGTIATQKTLSRGSTYRVSGTLTIASGGSLTIPPGTVLKMEDKAAIVVNSGATLNAVGTRAAPITFTSIKDDTISGDTNGDGSNTIPQPGDWEEIKNNGGTMNLAFVTALYGGYGQYSNQGDAIIRTTNGETKMDCCVVKHSNLRLVGRTGGTVYAENCILEDGRWGIDGAVTFVNGVIANCNTGANGATLKNSILWVCDTYASGGTASNCVAYGEITTVQTGMTYADPLFVDPVNGDFRVKEGSPCVDAADGAVAPELDFYGQPRITITDHGDELVGQLADIGVCEVMPRDMVSDIDLVPQSVRTTTNAVPGQLLFVKWEIANVGGREVDAAWRDTVSLVSESGREVVLGVKTTSSRIGVGGSVFCSGYFTVPAIAEGTWYPKVNVNSYHDIFEGSLAANNALTGERAVSVGLEALDPSISREGVINGGTPTVLKFAFGEDDANRMVVFDVPNGVTATWGFGFMPQGASKSGAMTAAGDGVMFKVPDGATEVYVVLESDTTTTYDLFTESAQMVIANVSPATLPSSGTTTLTISGAGFGDDCEVALMSTVGRVVLNAQQKDSSGNLIATVDCATLIAGRTYDVCVLSGGMESTLPNAVSVIKAEGKGLFWTKVNVPDAVREGRIVSIIVEYGNSGTVDIPPQIVQMQVSGGVARVAGYDIWGQTVNVIATGCVRKEVLSPGETGKVVFEYKASAVNSIQIYDTFDREFDYSPWSTREAFFGAMSNTVAKLSLAGVSLDDWTLVYDSAIAEKNNTGYLLCGIVTDSKGSGVVAGVDMQLLAIDETGHTNVCEVTRSDNLGKFYFADVAQGEYLLTPSLVYSLDYVNDMPVCGYATVTAGDVLEPVMLGITSVCSAKLYLAGENQSNASVSARRTIGGEEVIIPAVYDSLQGCYCLGRISEEGVYSIVAICGDTAYAKPVYLSFGDSVCVEGTLAPRVRLSGRVEDLSEHRLPDGTVVVIVAHNISANSVTSIEVTNDGSFTAEGLLPGEYILTISGTTCSYVFDDIYDFAQGGDFTLVVSPCPTTSRMAVTHPASWGGGYGIVATDGSGVQMFAQSSQSGEVLFESVTDGCWMCYAIDLSGNLVAKVEIEVKNGNGSGELIPLIDSNKLLAASASRRLRGFWSDFTDAIYEAWHAFRDAAADWLAGWEWANNVFDKIFQSGKYNQGVVARDDAQKLVLKVPRAPENCKCGYNKRKYAVDKASYDNFNNEYKQFCEFLRTCDRMKAVAMTFKTVGDTSELAFEKLLKKNAAGLLSTIGKMTGLAQQIATAKKFIKSHKLLSGTVLYGGMYGKDIYDMIAAVDEERITQVLGNVKFAIEEGGDIMAAISDLSSLASQFKGFGDVETRRALNNVAPEIADFFGDIAKIADLAVKVITIVEDVFSAGSEWKKYSNAIAQFDGRYNCFVANIDSFRQYAESFNRYHPVTCREDDEPKMPPVPPRKPWTPEVPRSFDPNEMVGPVGLGDPETERFVKPGEELTYTIYFENKSDATAAAQEVYVTNPLSEWLDWSTLKMGEVAFNNQIDLGLNGKPSGSSEATMKGTNFLVRTTLGGGYDGADSIAASGVAHWYLRIVDPTTDTGWPKDILAGFLPPNDETFRGEGHLTYTIKVREDAPANVVITNSATIVFDYNPSIKTDPAWWNTVAPDVGEAAFAEAELETDEGSNVVVRVKGGDAYTNSSVKVYLTYQTAAAADLDLANAALDGVTPKGGLKFPLTLSWEAGEIGEKVITIPIKADALLEGEEMFTLQLVDARGMELGENGICTVTVKDAQWPDGMSNDEATEHGLSLLPAGATPVYMSFDGGETQTLVGYFTKADKKGNVTAKPLPGYVFVAWAYDSNGKTYSTKATITEKLRKSKKVHPVFEPAAYLRALVADPATGTAKGQGLYAIGKAVTLAATPKKGYAFTGWRAGTGNGVISLATSLKVANGDATTTYVASFKKESELARPVLTLADAHGTTSSDAATGNDRTLSVGVSYPATLAVEGESNVSITKVTGLPTGLKYKGGKITGVPTKAGKFTASAVVALASNKKKTWVCKVPFEVVALPEWARGVFSGIVIPANGEWGTGSGEQGASATMSIGTTGKISGKFALGGTNWTFSASSFAKESVVTGGTVRLVADMTATGKWKSGKSTKTAKVPFGFVLVADPATSAIASATEGGYFGEADGESGPGAVEFRRDAGVSAAKGGDPAGGSVSLSVALGQAAAGKSVKATAKLAKGYALAGWYEVSVDEWSGDATTNLLTQALSCSVEMAGEDVFLVAEFRKESELARPVLSWGGEVWPDVAGTNLTVGVAYSAALSVEGEAKASIVKVAGLPAGLAWKGGRISGAPTKAGSFTVTVTAALSTNAKKTWTYKQALSVAALPGYAKGTFTGAANVDNYYAAGLAAVTVGATGKISGKFDDGGTNWTFSAASYTGIEGGAFVCSNLVATYTWKSGKATKKATRTFALRVDQLAIDDGNAGSAVLGHALAEEIVPDEGPEPVEIVAWQNLWGSEYKAIGNALFYTSAKKLYKEWPSVEASDLGEYDTLSVKVTTAGAVTATLKRFKGTFDAKGVPQYATYTCSTTLIPRTSAEAGAEAFAGGVPVFFPATGYFAQVEFPFSERAVPVPTQE